MALVTAICPECHETVKVDDSKPFGFCLSCGAKIAISANALNQNRGPSVSEAISNFIQLATSAKTAGNNLQCEVYCNKIIELDSSNAAAWALKASATGWQSTLANLRIEEMILYYSKAVANSQDMEQRTKIQKMAAEDFESTMKAVFSLQCDRFKKWPDAEEASAFKKLHLLFLQYAISFLQGVRISINTDAMQADHGVMVNNAVVVAEANIIQEYANSNNGHPTDYDFTRYIQRMGYAETAYENAAMMCENDYCNYPIIINNIIRNNNNCINSNSWSYEYVGQYTGSVWWPHSTLTDEAVRYRQGIIQQLETKKTEAERRKTENDKQIKKECIELYWQDHAEEKSKLEKEKGTLQSEIAKLNQQLNGLEPTDEMKELARIINSLQEQRAKMGLFKIKDKKALDEKILNLKIKSDSLTREQRAPFEDEIGRKQARLSSIESTLTRDRTEYKGKTKTKPYNGSVTATSQTWVTHRAKVK